jgi:hypothetical protein
MTTDHGHDETDDIDETTTEEGTEPSMLDVLGRTIVAMQAQLDVALTVFRVLQLDETRRHALNEDQRRELRELLHVGETGGNREMPRTFGQRRPADGPIVSTPATREKPS